MHWPIGKTLKQPKLSHQAKPQRTRCCGFAVTSYTNNTSTAVKPSLAATSKRQRLSLVWQFIRWNNAKESSVRPHAKPAFVMLSQIYKAVKALAINQRLKITAHANIG